MDWAEYKAKDVLTLWVNEFITDKFPKAKPIAYENMRTNWEHLIPHIARALREARDAALEEARQAVLGTGAPSTMVEAIQAIRALKSKSEKADG